MTRSAAQKELTLERCGDEGVIFAKKMLRVQLILMVLMQEDFDSEFKEEAMETIKSVGQRESERTDNQSGAESSHSESKEKVPTELLLMSNGRIAVASEKSC